MTESIEVSDEDIQATAREAVESSEIDKRRRASAKLRRAGLVCSVRGPGGGYLLAHPADGIRIYEVILAVAEPIRATRCQPGQPFGCRANKGRCLTHDLGEELGNQIYLYLSAVTLADVVERRVLGTSGLIGHDGPLADRSVG